MLWAVSLCRLMLAATLIFSGFVKAVDPKGMFYKANAYFAHWNIPFADDSVLLMAGVVTLAVIEFMLGIYLLLGIRSRFTTQATLVFMGCMTAVTAYVFLFNPVPDCGCFGTALTLTNGETLAKNIVLLLAAIVVATRRRYLLRLISERNQWITSFCALTYIILLNLYAIHYLPPIDFTPFSVGTDMRKAYTAPTADTPAALIGFSCSTEKGEDVTDSLLRRQGYTFLLTLPDPASADDGCNDRINDIYDACTDSRQAFLAVVPYGAGRQTVNEWIDRTGAAYTFLLADGDQLKAMVRSNPGLLLLKDGVVIGKWSNNDLPDLSGGFSVARLSQSASSRLSLLKVILCFLIPVAAVILADRLWIGSKFYRQHIFRQRLKKQFEHEKENRSRQLEDEQDPARRLGPGQGTQR